MGKHELLVWKQNNTAETCVGRYDIAPLYEVFTGKFDCCGVRFKPAGAHHDAPYIGTRKKLVAAKALAQRDFEKRVAKRKPEAA
jgi:hypothetical protein